ncbi:hypothetical protein N0V90_003995 [Kalmusia sp. IMI 367209]|nr:hypothetical protein N0V90_003995 [Kalmusia sp. IMI 367209]
MAAVPSMTSSAAPSASSSACTTTSFSEFPTKDSACAVGGTSGFPSNYSDILKDCCKSAPVESWGNDCALYCLAADQSIADLQKCWQEGGVKAGDIFCNGASNATATGAVSGTAGGAKETGQTGSKTGGASSATGTPGAAWKVEPQGVSKAGVGMLCLVLGSAMLGALL